MSNGDVTWYAIYVVADGRLYSTTDRDDPVRTGFARNAYDYDIQEATAQGYIVWDASIRDYEEQTPPPKTISLGEMSERFKQEEWDRWQIWGMPITVDDEGAARETPVKRFPIQYLPRAPQLLAFRAWLDSGREFDPLSPYVAECINMMWSGSEEAGDLVRILENENRAAEILDTNSPPPPDGMKQR